MDVAAWLRSLGLEQHEAAFRLHEIDPSMLPRLTAGDLTDLGITLVGHRRRLLEAIAVLSPEQASVADVPISVNAERRHLTVMFCDLVGATPLSARFDPEDLRRIIGSYHRCVSETVESFGGFVARYMGDGALIYFGYPQAYEDEAERATRCGLALAERVPQLVQAEELHARIGIATGLVVIGGQVVEHDVIGETPNLAARLQALAEPDTVVVAASTRRLIGNLFEYRYLGPAHLKGIAASVSAWQVLRPSGTTRFEARRGSRLSAIVGRDEEIDVLLRRWARAKAGHGQVVLVRGEPGIGKSHLTAAFEQRLHSDPHVCLRYFCSPYYQNTALFPFADQLGRAAGFARDDRPEAKLEKLKTLLAGATASHEDVALLADLLSMPASEHYPLPDLSPQRKKDRTLEALIRQLANMSQRQPVVVVFEDVHWIDPTSRELLDLAVERTRDLPVLVIMTFRSEFQPTWFDQPQVAMLALGGLDRRDRTALVEQIADGNFLPSEVVDQIVERTDGVPLFVEELTKSVLESGFLGQERVLGQAPPSIAIPTSLRASLLARLDRLASVRRVAQIGAAIGREFSYGLLQAVAQLPEEELQVTLERLVASELVFEHGTPPESVYSFKHALVQEAAHDSLLRSNRRQLHALIAEALETLSPELIEVRPELFAQHYAEARLTEKSVSYWSKAGYRSASRSAMSEAAAHFRKALDQVALLPETPERRRQKLEFWTALGAALNAAKGGAAPETGRAYASARKLWERLGSPPEFCGVPFAQSLYHSTRGEFEWAMLLGEDLLRLSRERNDCAGLVLGHLATGRNLLMTGQLVPSRSHLEKALALHDPISHRALVDQVGRHPHVSARSSLGLALFLLGFPDQALVEVTEAMAEARRLDYPASVAESLVLGGILLAVLRDRAVPEGWAAELVTLATEQGLPHWREQGMIYRGWVKVSGGDVAGGMSLLRSSRDAFSASGAKLLLPHYIGLLATACEVAGPMEEAVTLLDDALESLERTGERWLEADLYRLKGRMFLRQERFEIAEELYYTALELAEEQGAKLWELRAATSLAQLYCDQGRHAEARDVLAPVYDWFTEGFETDDLREAKALLHELA